MTLSLDDVRNKRFRMARKSGYEVLEVDEFVDEIEESFAQLLEENQNLKKQVESLRVSDDTRPVTTVSVPPSAAPQRPTSPAPSEPTTAPQTVVVTTAKEASSAVVRLVQLSTEQAEQLLAEASQEAARIRDEAKSTAQQVTTEARTRAEQLQAEARSNAERLQAQTLSRSEQLGQEIDKRRAEMLSQLQSQREALSVSVRELRAFEAAYRSNLTEHLRSQMNAVQSGRAEPTPVPELAPSAPAAAAGSDGSAGAVDGSAAAPAEGGPGTETPRLNALLGDQR